MAYRVAEVAFGGAGARAPVESGAACALLDAGFVLQTVAGTSAGSINAGALAVGMRWYDIRDLACKVPMEGLFQLELSAIIRGYACTGDALRDWVRARIGNTTLGSLKTPIEVMASNLTTRDGKLFTTRETPDVWLHEALRASSSVPVAYRPMVINGDAYVDGGLADNVPADDLPRDPQVAKFAFYVDTDGTPTKPTSWLQKRIAEIDLALGANQAARMTIARSRGVRVIRLPVPASYGMLDFNLTERQRTDLFNTGYAATKKELGL